MDPHTLSRLLVVVVAVLSFIYCHTVPDSRQQPDRNSTDPHVWLALRAINDLFINKGDSKRVVERIVSVSAQGSSESQVVYKYEIEVSGGATKELCNVTVLRRPGTPSEPPKISVVDLPLCYPQSPESDQHKNDTNRRKRSDPWFEDALDFLDREMTILTNSSKYLRFKKFKRYTRPRANYIVYNVEFVKSPCTLEYMDLTHDFWGPGCYVDTFNAQTVVVCSVVEISLDRDIYEFSLVRHNCTKTSFFR